MNDGPVQEVANSFGFVALRLDEDSMTAELVGIVKRVGDDLVAKGVDFESESFGSQSAIEAGADPV